MKNGLRLLIVFVLVSVFYSCSQEQEKNFDALQGKYRYDEVGVIRMLMDSIPEKTKLSSSDKMSFGLMMGILSGIKADITIEGDSIYGTYSTPGIFGKGKTIEINDNLGKIVGDTTYFSDSIQYLINRDSTLAIYLENEDNNYTALITERSIESDKKMQKNLEEKIKKIIGNDK
jgi:hypothetical protein